MLPGLLLLLLGLPFTCGQTEDTLMGSKVEAEHNVTFEDQVEADHYVTFEDQENFQNQEKNHQSSRCNEGLLMNLGEICWNKIFHKSMMALGEENWCDWDSVIWQYNHLVYCLEEASYLSYCYFPGPIVQKLFVDIHKQYFSSCITEATDFPDAPLSVVLIATLLPVSIIPIAVYLVFSKSNIKD